MLNRGGILAEGEKTGVKPNKFILAARDNSGAPAEARIELAEQVQFRHMG